MGFGYFAGGSSHFYFSINQWLYNFHQGIILISACLYQLTIIYMPRRQFKDKETGRPTFNSHNNYLSLTANDALYRSNLKILKTSQFKAALSKFTRDFNLLLEMTDKQFWKQLRQNQTLGIALQSCLNVFARRGYDRYESNGLMQQKYDDKDMSLKEYSLLMKIVIFVYYRIAETNDEENKELIYNQWLLDIPKLLDLAAIYGESNPQLVTNIIGNIYKSIKNYDADTLDFFGIIQEHDLLKSKEEYQVVIDFSPKSLSRKNYGNRETFMMQTTAKEIFKVKNLLMNLINFMKFFPKQYCYEFSIDYKIQERLLKGLAKFLKESAEDWKMGDYEKYFQWHLEDIRQTIATYLLTLFQHLRNILEGNCADMPEQQIDLAYNTFQTLCLCLSQKQGQAENPYYKRMINHLLEQSQEIVFFVPATKIKKAINKTHKSIEECVQYENHYRKQKRLAGTELEYDEIYEKFKKSLKKYNQISAKKDGKQVRQLEEKREKERLIREPLTGKGFRYIFDLKYSKISDEYYDEPEEEDEFKRPKPEIIHDEQTNTDFNFKAVKKDKRHDQSSLSIWDLDISKVSEADLSINLSASSGIVGLKENKRDKTFNFEEGKNIPEIRRVSPFEVDKSADLSIFEIEKGEVKVDDLSFSEVIKEAKYEGEGLRAQSQLETILADINSEVNSQENMDLEDIKGSKDEFEQEAQFFKFSWRDDQNLSFPDI